MIAPSILRSSQNTLQTSISHTRNVLVACQLLFEHFYQLFPQSDDGKGQPRRITPHTLFPPGVSEAKISVRDPKSQEKLAAWKAKLHESSEEFIANFTEKQNHLNRSWAGVLDQLEQGVTLTPAIEASVEQLLKEEELWRSNTLKQLSKEITNMQPLVDSVKADHATWMQQRSEEDGSDGIEIGVNTAALNPIWVVAMYNIQPDEEEELALKEGEKVLVLDNSDTKGWWQGRKEDGTVGIFPYNFVRVL